MGEPIILAVVLGLFTLVMITHKVPICVTLSTPNTLYYLVFGAISISTVDLLGNAAEILDERSSINTANKSLKTRVWKLQQPSVDLLQPDGLVGAHYGSHLPSTYNGCAQTQNDPFVEMVLHLIFNRDSLTT